MTRAIGVDVPQASSCAFCDYLTGKRPYTILSRSGTTAILVTREQRGSPHLLVLPVRHRETLLDLVAVERGDLMDGVVEAARLIDAAEKRPGIVVWQNNGVAADQTIPHVHFHVAGTLPGGSTERGDVRELSLAETQAIADRLKRFHRS